MIRRKKLIAAILNNPRDVRFEDACRVAEWLGFSGGPSKGSHHSCSRPGEQIGLNFQNKGGRIPPYQGRQLVEMIEKYLEGEC